MLRPRIIPSLLLHDKGLVKTVNFKSPKYIGDPINAIRIFNEKQVDELALFDISVTKNKTQIDFDLLKDIAVNANMPMTYGGGIKTVADASKIISLGFEKVSISSAFFDNPEILNMVTAEVGAQSVSVCLDVKKVNSEYSIFTHRGTIKVKLGLLEALELLENNSFGEIIINSIDRDGTFSGYDMELARIVRENTSVNITILGGCTDLANIVDLEKQIGVCGCAAGSFYTFVGKNNAVLLNYNKPTV